LLARRFPPGDYLSTTRPEDILVLMPSGVERLDRHSDLASGVTACSLEDTMPNELERTEPPMVKEPDVVTRIFGGSPLAVLVRLILVSVLVGVILSAFGLDPFDIIHSIERLIRNIWNMGFDAIRWLWRYFLLGAAIVIPIWLIMRAVNASRGK
jgi:hypothetical protein